MTLTGKRFSANSFSGFGGHRMVSSGGCAVGSAGIGRSMFGGFGSNGIGKGFGAAGGGGGHGSGFGFGGMMRGGAGAGAGQGAGMGGDASLGIVGNEKMQMQYLNDRFAAYLEKVRMLEANNYELEQQLRSITFSKVVPRDFSDFDVLIQQLTQQLLIVLTQNNNISLQIDNAKLAADDFRVRWESELSLRQTLEGDMAGLRTLQQDYDMASQATAQELQSLMNDFMTMKKNHQQEILSMANKIGSCNVNMQVAESVDLSQVLADIRAEYEAVMDYNRRNAESWYIKQAEMKQPQTTQVNKTVVGETQEVANGQQYFHTLQMELEGLVMGNESLEARHAEVEAQYQQTLMNMSCLVADLEGDVSCIHQGIAQQREEYHNLLDIKSRLEMEIGTYKQLLEEGGIDGSRMVSLAASGGSARRVMGVNFTGRGVEAAMGASRGIGRASFTMKSSKTTSSSGISSGTSKTVTTSSISGDAVGVPVEPKKILNVASVTSGGGAEVEGSVVTSVTTISSSVSSSSEGATVTSSAVADIPEAADAVTVSSEDAPSGGDSAVMTSEGGTLVITSIVTESSSSSSETAMMSSAGTEGLSAAGDVTIKPNSTEFISSGEALIASAGAAEATMMAAVEDMMNEGSVTVGTTEFSASSTGSGGAMMSSEGAIISDGDTAIEFSDSTISSGNGVISVLVSSDEGVMVSGEEAVGASMSSEDAIMVSGGEVEGASMSVQSNGSEFSSSSSSAIIADSTVEGTVSSVKIALVEE
ncbi:uncharacterized protein ACJ7VT_018519 [Polymixia lowei]